MRVNWVEEEIRLLISFYQKMQSGDMHKAHPLVIQASEAIRNLSINKEYSQNDPKFRNPNGIALKLANFLFLDPNYSGKGMKGCSVLDKKIFNEFYMTDILKTDDVFNKNTKNDLEKLINAFIVLIPEMGVKGSPMGQSNPFNGLAQEFDVSYAGSTVKAPKVENLNTSPIISFGLGRFTHVPWIVFTNYDQKVMAGIYPALLFYTEEQKIILAYGVSESNDSNINWNENTIKDLPLIRDILPRTDKYLSSYVYKMYDIPSNLNLLNIEELILNLEKVIGDFHEQFQNKSEIIKQSIQMKTPQYPFAFKNWFSSNIGGVRLPMNNKSGRPIGDQIIEGKIHQLIREMISDFKVTKGKFLCVLVGGPGNGKTDLMEFASEVFFEEFNIDPKLGKETLQDGFKSNNRKAKYENKEITLNLIQDASQRDSDADSPLASIYNDFEELHKCDNILTLICINRGVLENTLSKSRVYSEPISKYKELINKIHSYNNLQTVINDSKIWGDNISGINLFTWSMDFDTLFKENETISENLIKELIDKSNCINSFKKAKILSPIESSREFLNNEIKLFNLSRLLRHSEILNGKRFTYRELFSIMAYLFHHSEEANTNYENVLTVYESIPTYELIEKFNILFPLYLKSTSFRFFNYFIEPKKDLIDSCLKPYANKKQHILKQMFETLSNVDKNISEIPNFISSRGSSLFDPIYFEENNFEFKNDNGDIFKLKKIIDKILYNQLLNCEDFTAILQPIDIELIQILEKIKDSYCLNIDYDDFNATQLNGVDLLKTYLNNLIVSIFKRSLLFSNFYIRDKDLVQEYLDLVQNDSSAFIHILEESLTTQNKIENSLSTNIGQTAGELKNNIIEKSNIVNIESLPKPLNSMPSSDQIILTYSVRGQQNDEIIVITYNLFKSIKKNEKHIFSACLDKNYLLWQELKKIELSNRSNVNGGEIYIPDMGDKRIKVTRSPFKIQIV
jgi:hypothetical protein